MHAADQHFITIGTAGVTGVYYPSGVATCKILNENRAEHGIRCSVETTLGSISNVNQIRKGELDFGFVQSDWQHHAYNGTSVFEDAGPFTDLRSVLSLHSEVATIAVRAGSGFNTFADLKGAKINAGSEGSGSEASWQVLIDRLGWSVDDRKNVSNLKTSALAEALCDGEIDAYFMLIGHPAGLIDETMDRCDIRLLGFEDQVLEEFLGTTPYYTKAVIPAGLYGREEPVGSFGVIATIVTSAEMPDTIVYTLVKAVSDNLDSLKSLHPALGRVEQSDLAAYDAAAPLHRGALKFFTEQGLLPAK